MRTICANKIRRIALRLQMRPTPHLVNCFTEEGLDIKEVSGPFDINTEGKLGISITNVRLQKLSEGEKGCAK